MTRASLDRVNEVFMSTPVVYGHGEGVVIATGMKTEIGKIVIDTRAVENGDLFAAFRGERVDGHDYIPAAFERGAAC